MQRRIHVFRSSVRPSIQLCCLFVVLSVCLSTNLLCVSQPTKLDANIHLAVLKRFSEPEVEQSTVVTRVVNYVGRGIHFDSVLLCVRTLLFLWQLSLYQYFDKLYTAGPLD